MRAPLRPSRWLLLPAALLLARALPGGERAGRDPAGKARRDAGQARARCAKARARSRRRSPSRTRRSTRCSAKSRGCASSSSRSSPNWTTSRASSTGPPRSWKPKSTGWRSFAPVCSGRSGCCANGSSRCTRPGSPDVLNVVLESETWSQASVRAEYLSRVQDYDNSVADRVKGLRDEAKAAVERMAAIRAAAEGSARRDRGQGARSRRRPRRSRGPLRRPEGSPGPAPAGAGRARVARTGAQRQPRGDLRTARRRRRAGRRPARRPRSPPARAPNTSPKARRACRARAPPAVQAAIEAANSIATTPYIWGGGHGSFESSGYDCSGAVSFALNGGGFLSSPLDSTGLETWGDPGPGQWITVYANAEHAWMIIAGLAFDTVGGPGPRWHP